MWQEIFGKIPDGMCILHNCDNTSCINPTHLFLGTQSDNVRDMVLKDRHGRGEKNRHAKLTNEDVLTIRQSLSKDISQTDIAALYNVKPNTISQINTGTTWSHI